MASSDIVLVARFQKQKNATTQRVMEVRPYTSIKANIVLNIPEIPCYLVNKLRKNSVRH